MHRAIRLVVASALLVLTFAVGSCGGGSATNFGQVNSNSSFVGISQDGFKAVRYNDEGYADSSLNPTMKLNVERSGDTTVVSVDIADAVASSGVMLDLGYDAGSLSPVDAHFDGLINTPIELAVTGVAGTVGLGQVGNRTTGIYHGHFATVTFKHEPFARTVSAVNGAYDTGTVDAQYPALNGGSARDGFVLTDSSAADGNNVTFNVSATFAHGDGNSDGQTLVSDLATIGQVGLNRSVSATDAVPAIADYNFDGTVSIQDLTTIGLNFQKGYTGVEILLGDSNTFSDSDTAVLTLSHDTGAPPTSDYATPNTNFDQIFRFWNGSLTPAQVQAADTNHDGTVFISARVVDANAPVGKEHGPAFPGLSLNAGAVLPSDVVVADYTYAIDGGTGGTGTDGNEFADGAVATMIANSSTGNNFYVSAISGTYQAAPFTAADAGTVIPQAIYDQALAAVQQSAQFVASDAGDAAMLKTGPVVTIGAFNGEGNDATVFPDDDPESTGASSEGVVVCTVPANGTGVPADIIKTVKIDVTTDPTAPLFSTISTPDGQDVNGDWKLSAVTDTVFTGGFTFGTGGAPGTIDGTTVAAELYDLDTNSAQALNYADPLVNPLDFRVRDAGGGNFGLEADFSPSNLQAGDHYTVRFHTLPGNFNSINKPGQRLVLGPLPVPQALNILPGTQIGTSDNTLSFFYADPLIRRNGKVTIQLDGSVDAAFQGSFDDVLKTSGDSFTWQGPSGAAGPWPEVTFLETADPADIDNTTTGLVGPILITTASDTGFISVDIAALPDPVGPNTKTYSFKVFGKPTTAGDQSTRPTIGFGTFTINGLATSPAPISGTDFGFNVFDGSGRGDLALGAADFSHKTLTLSTLLPDQNAAGAPPVLFVQWSGGRVGDPVVNNDVHVVATDVPSAIGSEDLPLQIRAVGLGGGGIDYLGTYIFSDLDKQSGGGGGVFTGGVNYNLVLSDGVSTNFPFVSTITCVN